MSTQDLYLSPYATKVRKAGKLRRTIRRNKLQIEMFLVALMNIALMWGVANR